MYLLAWSRALPTKHDDDDDNGDQQDQTGGYDNQRARAH